MSKDDVFMSLLPRNNLYLKKMVESIPLRVVKADGVEYSPNIKFTGTDLNNGNRLFHNNSGNADSFKVTVMLSINDTFSGQSYRTIIRNGVKTEGYVPFEREVYYWYNEDSTHELEGYVSTMQVLDYFIRQGEPFYIHTRAIGIPNDVLWLCTKQDKRKQTNDVFFNREKLKEGYVLWDLTFTKYKQLVSSFFRNDDTLVNKAIQQYNKKKEEKANAKKTTAKAKTTDRQKLAKCDYKKLVYSKKKKTTNCIKLMQSVLYTEGCLKGKKAEQLDGWYGDKTKQAVKAYQKKYAKRDSLKQTGKVDKKTFNSLCGQVGATKTIGSKNANKVIVTEGKQVKSVPKANNTIS